jgi:ABC-type branched-subunit amino acid transport system substrate-binding protein
MTANIAILVPQRESPGTIDQALGARLAALQDGLRCSIDAREIPFRPEQSADLEGRVVALRGQFSAVVGATNVPESTRLGELAEELGLLCFVANNNPSVWNGKRHVFHIGVPSAQTAEAVALHLKKLGLRRVQLVHDRSEFQERAASCALASLRDAGLKADSRPGAPRPKTDAALDATPDLFYLLYSDEAKALAAARDIGRRAGETPLLFGRSLLRESFISALGEDAENAWFVDMIPRTRRGSPLQERFAAALSEAGVRIPTANHCFGWDLTALSLRALSEAKGDPEAAVDYLESGAVLEGVAGNYRFVPGNHNGRSGIGPTMLSRWKKGRVEEMV